MWLDEFCWLKFENVTFAAFPCVMPAICKRCLVLGCDDDDDDNNEGKRWRLILDIGCVSVFSFLHVGTNEWLCLSGGDGIIPSSFQLSICKTLHF